VALLVATRVVGYLQLVSAVMPSLIDHYDTDNV